MPVYCYECDSCGRVQEEYLPRPRPAQSLACRACGGTARRSYAAEGGRGPSTALGASEIRSVAAGVMPHQAAGAERALAAAGVEGVCFDRRTGDAIFAGRAARLRALKAMGLHDKDEIRG